MALSIDVSKPFRFHRELVQLVKAVLRAGGADEARWIEWKGTLDLKATQGQQHLARQILGFANRDPDVAARWAGGYAYLIVGAEPGATEPAGVAVVDAANLEAQLAKWLPDEIVWNMDYVRIGTADVLVIAVDPPSWGDPIHTLQKAISSHTPGTVYVRHQASIDTANPADMRMLQRRYAAGTRRTRLEITPSVVEVEPRPNVSAFIDQWRADAERRLMHYVDQPATTGRGYSRLQTSGPAMVTTTPDPRTPEEYINEVTRYLKVAESAITDRADRLLPRRRLTPIRLTVRNVTDHTLDDVELIMVFHGQAQIQLVDLDSPAPELPELPEPPAPLGTPRTAVRLSPAIRGALASADQALRRVQPMDRSARLVTLPRSKRPSPEPVTTRRTPNGLEIRFHPFDLRAEGSCALPLLLLDVFEPEGTTCELSWRATSNSHDGAAKGSLTLKLVKSTFDLSQLAATSGPA